MGPAPKQLKLANHLLNVNYVIHYHTVNAQLNINLKLYPSNKRVCNKCRDKVDNRYNPFDGWSGNDTDKHYDDICGEDVLKISSLLSQCKSHDVSTLNSSLESITKSTECTMSSLFFNIDGNYTNFDHFSVILKSINHKFSAIGLAETNTDPETASTFVLPGYTSFYQKNSQKQKVWNWCRSLYF